MSGCNSHTLKTFQQGLAAATGIAIHCKQSESSVKKALSDITQSGRAASTLCRAANLNLHTGHVGTVPIKSEKAVQNSPHISTWPQLKRAARVRYANAIALLVHREQRERPKVECECTEKVDKQLDINSAAARSRRCNSLMMLASAADTCKMHGGKKFGVCLWCVQWNFFAAESEFRNDLLINHRRAKRRANREWQKIA
jgi:hypothetical protein